MTVALFGSGDGTARLVQAEGLSLRGVLFLGSGDGAAWSVIIVGRSMGETLFGLGDAAVKALWRSDDVTLWSMTEVGDEEG